MPCNIDGQCFHLPYLDGVLISGGIFVARYSDCSTNGIFGLNDLVKTIAAG
jgi:hypothetical protein